MNYKKGADVLPDHLLQEIQEYVEGCLIYIPKKSKKAGWGILSGSRQSIDTRNKTIKLLFEQGEPIGKIAEQFHLEEDTIRKIVYRKK